MCWPIRFLRPSSVRGPTVELANNRDSQLSMGPTVNTIRLIEDGPLPGTLNMAIDEALLNSAMELGIATLRFYAWDVPTLSLGYFQPQADRNRHRSSDSCPLVRRHSGGGAIVHDHELTYALAWPLPARNRIVGRADDLANQLYSTIHQQFVSVLRSASVPAALFPSGGETPRPEPFLCFQRRAEGDVVCAGHKILGSAQRRRQGAILQHGSLLLARSHAAPELPGLSELAGPRDHHELVAAWKERIFGALGLRPDLASLTDQEECHARELAVTKFSSAAWTNRR